MPAGAITICKFVGTISLGLLTGVSTTLTTVSLPALLTLPTAINARTTLSYLTTRNKALSSYLRHIATFALFSAYLLSPRRFRHPYLLYTSLFTFASGPGVDYALALRDGTSQRSKESELELDLEAQGDDVNGEQVRLKVEKLQFVESVRMGVEGLAFAMGVVGIWGDGA
ncbi:hypothetical protein K505DRAFT_361130 [Melanomma pulvis-pyrius CBS 109.77]|uniref:DUF1772-domain-containing protein n=1 Tax=Melanomma pulvis-pyrius CBS 109.77 TaxID=1314802 RepID=A0A6A6XCQ3_9PLEO|nr:hypothetical protein K505DRAFT_361130 [Melanomma pulvis-pyrius CBS 109.77]